jgi:hypothetical protein
MIYIQREYANKPGTHRYELLVDWPRDKSIPTKRIYFVGLNPSYIYNHKVGPTLLRMINLATLWGYNAVGLINVYSNITPYPRDLVFNPVEHLKNLDHILTLERDIPIVFAWGNSPVKTKIEPGEIISHFTNPQCLGYNFDKTPKHVLTLSVNTPLIPYKPYVTRNDG